ncbi:PfkB family carbohydrate kinase [Belnapia rosea]|uniref:Sulfofructose kinase n=1 Tax=Belnapia rosea TaxID=938405 RepID=A0A1G6KSY3_9PROT|nr:PfkB family carbohydrate kinase [Belnapia rosea]SDC34037.1 sulfofructose kinase [Belnapia rosea]
MIGSAPLVICLGHVVADHSFWVEDIPQPPAKQTARRYSLGVGGLAANAAIAVARMGGRVRFWGRVGDDRNGGPLAEELAGYGVDTSAIRIAPGARTPVSAVLLDPVGERVVIAFRGEGLDLDPGVLPMETLGQAQSLLCDPRWPRAAEAALRAARERGIPSVLDAEKSEARLLATLVPLVDHAIFSVPGLQIFAPGTSPTEGLRRALASGAKLAAVTRGERGTLWMAEGMETPKETPAFPVEATNTSGAGDVFHGAYALAIAEGMTLPEAMRFASAAGALRARDGVTADRAAVEALLLSRA